MENYFWIDEWNEVERQRNENGMRKQKKFHVKRDSKMISKRRYLKSLRSLGITDHFTIMAIAIRRTEEEIIIFSGLRNFEILRSEAGV